MLLFAALAANAQTARTPPDLAWLAGCWELKIPERKMTVTEHWMTPAGGTMIGMSRTVTDGKTTAFEFLRIIEREGTTIYIAKPSQNNEETEFKLTAHDKTSATFENPSHDFPQLIRYTRTNNDLQARAEATRNNTTRGFELEFKRINCP